MLFALSIFKRSIPALLASRRGTLAQGTLRRITLRQTSGGRMGGARNTLRTGHVEFVADGQRVTFSTPLDNGVEYHQGQHLPVHYNPVRPHDSATIDNSYDSMTKLMMLGGITLLFLFMSVCSILLIFGVIHDTGSTDPYVGYG
ncbi:hypothetical protein GXW82_06180 [Streptacidiphilus sp. 4-A2]|nr:hypothetical protein [Streptacidiphilus sp. 4-A2]